MIDNINSPKYYQGRYGMEAIDVVRNFMTAEQVKGFHLGNTLKYLLRFQEKNGLEDLKKARKNLDWLINEVESADPAETESADRIKFLEDELYNRAYKDIERLEADVDKLKAQCVDLYLQNADYVWDEICRNAVAREKSEKRRPYRKWLSR